MGLRWFRQALPPRLKPNPTAADWLRMARHPSAYAPTAAEVLTPPVAGIALPQAEPHLRAVLDDPDADGPRLAYAEWVEAADPARAEFIRRQLAGDPDAEILLGLHGRRWEDAFAPWGARDPAYRRGFAEGMSLTGRSFIGLGAGLFDAAPLREVRLIAVNFLMGELARCPHLTRLAVLDLTGNRIGDAGAEHLLTCPHLEGLRELHLQGNDLTDGMEARCRRRFGAAVRL